MNGGGTIDARSVEAGSVSAAVNGGGDMLVRPRDDLSAAINGGGLVRYSGNPQITSAVHGGGAVSAASWQLDHLDRSAANFSPTVSSARKAL